MSCPSWETAAAWLLGELTEAEAEAYEQHYFECEACYRRAERLERTAQVLSRGLPVTLTRARRDALVAREPLPVIDLMPGQRATLHLSEASPAGLWVMHFDEPAEARVDLEARSPEGAVLFGLADVAFDVEGRVYMPCQIHYQHVLREQPTLHVRLSAVGAGGAARPLGEYVLHHRVDSL